MRGERARGDRGAADALGVALLAPAAVGLALVVLFLSRQVDSRATAQSAAESAAQAAAQERTPAAAIAAAQSVGQAMLVDDATCAAPSVSVDVSSFLDEVAPMVSVSVSCTASVVGLESTGAEPSTHLYTAHATLDPFRATGP